MIWNWFDNLPVPYRLGKRTLFAPPAGRPLFTDNETNTARVFGQSPPDGRRYVKDAFHRAIVAGEDCTNPYERGTKAAIHYSFAAVPPGESVVLRLRLSDKSDPADPLTAVDDVVENRRQEADEFYATIHPSKATDDERLVQRQALSGLLWNKQCYIFDVSRWLEGDNPDFPPHDARKQIRNRHWKHLNSLRVMTLPDKWEYPWFAAWDLAFHCVSLALVDPQYAMDQLWVLLFEQFQHPNGQIPAYEWEFSDLNPPVHAWAVWRIYNMARHRGHTDRGFLERCFHKLLINFAWWVNKVDSQGNNVFEGGFLGLDNITVFDRSAKFADGVVLEQSDATGWMGMFCLNLMRIALELAKENREYEGLATKFFQHFIYVAAAMKRMGGRDYQLWDDADGFFYDVLHYADGRFVKIRVRSLVGLIPLFAIERLERDVIDKLPNFRDTFEWFVTNRRRVVEDVVHPVEDNGRRGYVLSIVNAKQLGRLLDRVWDSGEFLSDYGLRSLSKAHDARRPFVFEDKTVCYEPAEAVSKIKGGNSNWRGPIWFPTTFLLIESLRKLAAAWGPKFAITDPRTGAAVTTQTMAQELAERMIGIFARDARGRRPVFGDSEKFQTDPHWRDLLLFYEYFHGDTGAGLALLIKPVGPLWWLLSSTNGAAEPATAPRASEERTSHGRRTTIPHSLLGRHRHAGPDDAAQRHHRPHRAEHSLSARRRRARRMRPQPTRSGDDSPPRRFPPALAFAGELPRQQHLHRGRNARRIDRPRLRHRHPRFGIQPRTALEIRRAMPGRGGCRSS